MDDDLRKTLGEAIDAQVKGLAERQAINTAKYLNESYAGVRKEMNNEKLITRLKIAERYYDEVADRYYVGEISPLLREAVAKIELDAAEIERLEEKIGQSNSKYVQLASGLKETNDEYNKLIEENNRLEAAAKDRDEEIKDLEHILVGRNDTVDTVVKLNDEHIREKIRLKERVEELEENFFGYETVHIKPEGLFGSSGISNRDHIAFAAMDRLMSNGLHNSEIIARLAYEQADAMLKARKK